MANTRENQSNTSNRGFASMDSEKQREIAAKGGRSSHKSDSNTSERGSKNTGNK